MFIETRLFAIGLLVSDFILTSIGVCFGIEDSPTSNKPVMVDFLYQPQASSFVFASFDLGEVGIGEEIPVIIRVMNRSKTTFELSQEGVKQGKARFMKAPIQIPDGENGLVSIVVKIPEFANGLKDSLVMNAKLRNNIHLQMNFIFHYRNMAVFTKDFFVFALDVDAAETTSRGLAMQLPVEVSDTSVLDRLSVVADTSVQNLNFSVVRRQGRGLVEAKLSSELIAKKKVAGKVFLKVDDKVVSETNLVVKKRRDVELLPDFVTLRFDPVAMEYRGEIIASLLPNTTRIEHLRIEAEHSNLTIPVSLSIGRMSDTVGRVYIRIKSDEVPTNDDLILFQMSTPLKNESQILPIVVVR